MDFIIDAPIASFIFFITIGLSLHTMYNDRKLMRKLMLHPYSIHKNRNLYTIITSAFVHADMNHLLFNMLSFFFFAFQLEKIVGHIPFLIIYSCGIVFSDLSTLWKNKNNAFYYSLGASGAISAVLFSYILFDPLSKIYLFLIPIGIPAYIFALLYLAYCVYAAKKQYDNVNHEAHFYGAITGLVITSILFPHVLGYFLRSILA